MQAPEIDHLVADARNRADAFEIYARTANGFSIEYDKGQFQKIEREAFVGASVRAVKNGRIGFATGTGAEGIAGTLDTALRIAPWGGEFDYTFAPKAEGREDHYYDKSVEDLSAEDLARMGSDAKELLAELVPDAAFMAGVSASHGAARIVTSEGQDIVRRGTNCGFYVGCELNGEGDFLSVYKSINSNRRITAADAEAATRDAADEFRASRNVTPLAAGKYRVLFTPKCMSTILTPVKVSINGTNIEKKTSRWVESMGQRVLDARITLQDDPRHPEGCGSTAYDGEGMPTERRMIIERGVLRGLVHSRMTAAHCGQDATGNGQRGVESIARPGLHNLVMDAGDRKSSEMLAELDNGIVIDTLIGSFTSNFLAGQCSGGIMLGWLVKDGRRVGRVKNAAINVNCFDLMGGQLVGLSSDRDWVGGQELLPWMLVDGVAISSRG